MSRFMISPLGNSPVSAWNRVPNVHSPSRGDTAHFDSLCRPVGAQRTRRNPNPRLTPWAPLHRRSAAVRNFGLVS
jgi:hypothetical protein